MAARREPIAALFACFLLFTPRQIDAQGTGAICSSTALRAGRLTRVHDSSAASVVGPFASCRDSLLKLAYYPGQIDSGYSVRTALIRRVWVRGTQARNGLIFGAAAGALAGGGIAAMRSRICTSGFPPVYTTCHGNIPLNALLVGAAGGLAGWILGSGFPRWAKIYP